MSRLAYFSVALFCLVVADLESKVEAISDAVLFCGLSVIDCSSSCLFANMKPTKGVNNIHVYLNCTYCPCYLMLSL